MHFPQLSFITACAPGCIIMYVWVKVFSFALQRLPLWVFVHERWITLAKVSLCFYALLFSWYLQTCFNGVYIVCCTTVAKCTCGFSSHLFLKWPCCVSYHWFHYYLIGTTRKSSAQRKHYGIVVVEWMALLLL